MMHEARQSPTGTIYDIGYQHYEGERLGRWNALRTIFEHGLRTVFGIGRGEKAKLLPLGLLSLALVPAIVQSWLGAAIGDVLRIVSYENYFEEIRMIFLIFCAAQAPELVTTDQHNKVLPLYFVRPLHRTDYAAGKLAALIAALLVIGLAGQIILLAGRIFAAEDVLAGVRDERGAILPILGATLLGTALLASLSLAIAAHMKARTLATAAIFGTFLITAALPPLLTEALGQEQGRYAFLLSPMLVVNGTAHWLFEAEAAPRSMLATADLPLHYYAIAGAVLTAAMVLLLLHRSRRIRL
jgi:ABC-2 type transport system permease protein